MQEKLDGSLIIVTSYQGQWVIATSGTPDGAGEVVNTKSEDLSFWYLRPGMPEEIPTSFAAYFRQVARLYTTLFDGPAPDLGGWCYLFELMGPLNRIVVQHEWAKIAILGARHVSGDELHPGAACAHLVVTALSCNPVHLEPIPVVRSFELRDLATIRATFDTMSPLEQEGYVVCDAAFRRVKVKSPKYAAMHHAKDGLSNRAFVEIVRSGEADEFCAAFGSFAGIVSRVEDIRVKYVDLCQRTRVEYARIQGIPVQKDYAKEALQFTSPAVLFQLRAGKVATPEQFFAQVQIDSLMGYLGVPTVG